MVPLWIVALAAGMQMHEREELSGGNDGDFTEENREKIKDLRKEFRNYKQNTTTAREKIENSFENNFRQVVGTIGQRLGDIARGMDQAEQSFQAKLNSYGSNPLKGSDQVITKAAMAAQKS